LDSGKKKRLRRLFREDQRTVIVPMDHGVTVGPVRGLTNMQKRIGMLLAGEVDAFVLHKGIAKNVDTGKAGLVVHLSGSTKLGPNPNYKVQVCSVEEALRIGGDAVSVHVNIGAKQEAKMLRKLGRIADECDDYGIPLLAMMYPRGPKVDDQHNPDIIKHVARLGVELGADIIKTNYTGDSDTFREVVQSCCVPVIIAGGPKVETIRELLEMVNGSIKAGGAGVSIGRNVFQHENPTLMARAMSAIVHSESSVEESMSELRGS
jgi:predicted phospho-2-dehydro-3-deoxyheptonate aldolase